VHRVIAGMGSTKCGVRFIPRKFETLQNYTISKEDSDWSLHGYEPLIDSNINDGINEGKYETLGWDMKPGDVIAFHFKALHGAPGNPLTSLRRAVAFRFTGDDATISKKRPWVVSPPKYGGKQHGEILDSDEFPVVLGGDSNVSQQ